jgi:hypothetical protein
MQKETGVWFKFEIFESRESEGTRGEDNQVDTVSILLPDEILRIEGVIWTTSTKHVVSFFGARRLPYCKQREVMSLVLWQL